MQLTPDEIEAERERFEAAIIKLGRSSEIEWINGQPVWTSDKADWQLWLAAIASERARRKQEQAAAEALLKMQGWPEMEHRQEKWESGE